MAQSVTEEDFFQLFAYVEQNPSLYDISSQDYKNMPLNNNIWNSIAEKMGKENYDGQTWKKLWKSKRDTYQRYFFSSILLLNST